MQQQGDLVALGIPIDKAEAALHQMQGCLDHVISKPLVERSLELKCLPCKPCEVASIETGHYKDARQDIMVMRCFEDPQPFIEIVKVHRSMPVV